MENRNDFTDRYGPRYVVETYDDGITYLQTHHPDRNGITYDVYRYSCTHLAACLPPKAAIHCRKKHPEHFTIHQNAQDAIVLCFEESMLHELAGILRIRRVAQREKMDEVQRLRLIKAGRRFRFRTGSRDDKAA